MLVDASKIVPMEASEDQDFISFFKEHEQIRTHVETLLTQNNNENSSVLQSIEKILDPYQEQPHLLDSHLEDLVCPVLDVCSKYFLSSNPITDEGLSHLRVLFRFLYVLCKIRGHKTILKLFSHDVSNLEPTFQFLNHLNAILPQTNTVDSKFMYHEFWETRYILLLWISLICMIPFDLKNVDSGAHDQTMITRMIDVCKQFLSSPGKERDAAGLVLARLLTRKDTYETHLTSFIQWAVEEMQTTDDIFFKIGILNSICAILKYGPREFIHSISLNLLYPLFIKFNSTIGATSNSLLRKFWIKTTQRIGLSFLKPRVAKWRYNRGHRSLSENLGEQTVVVNLKKDVVEVEEEEDIYVPEEIEELVDILLKGLSDKDTIVRWSAAKGLGRLTNRLPILFAQEIIQQVVELFAQDTIITENNYIDVTQVSDHSWHGACLCIAEFSRRGLLLPEFLELAIPWIARALNFDIRKGFHSIGSHVRDAACYASWAFARAYTPEIMAPFVKVLSNSLVIVAVYDRDVNIRRAASAAFQEIVGRQGIFPHGIDIVTTADYFAVGNRTRSYLTISPYIAKFDEYRESLIQHLLKFSIVHWDKSIRELAARTFYELSFLSLDYMIDSVLPVLLDSVFSSDLNKRHGSVLAIAEICMAWSEILHKDEKCWNDALEKNNKLIEQIYSIVPCYPSEYLRCSGLDLSLISCCHLMTCLSKSNWPLKENLLKPWWKMIETALERREEAVQNASKLSVEYVSAWIQQNHPLFLEDLLHCEGWMSKIHIRGTGSGIDEKYATRGYCLALGVLPWEILHKRLEIVVEGLIEASSVKSLNSLNDAETRRNAIISLTRILCMLDSNEHNVTFIKITKFFLLCLEDYSTDSRGDVGSWIRIVAIEGLGHALEILSTHGNISDNILNEILNGLIRQSVEKIDRVRETAGNVLHSSIWIPQLESSELVRILRDVLVKDDKLNWLSPSDIFPKMIPLLNIPQLRHELIKGLIVSVGGMTESLVRHSSSSLIGFLSAEEPESTNSCTAHEFFLALYGVFKENILYDRISIPVLDVTDVLLFESGIFSSMMLNDCKEESLKLFNLFVDLIIKEMYKSKDVKKLSSGIKIYCGFIGDANSTQQLRNKCMKLVLKYLKHPFPKIRRAVAENLYICISTLYDVEGMDPDALGEAEELLLSANWDLSVSELRSSIETISKLLVI